MMRKVTGVVLGAGCANGLPGWFLMPRATAAESAERVDQPQVMILKGEPNTACLAYARQTWGVSRAQGYRLLKKAWTQIKDDIEESGIDC